MSEPKDELLDHNYDGIQEFDNPLPNWWLMTFYGAVVFAVIYMGYYHFGSGPSLEQELARDMDAIHAAQKAGVAAEPAPTEESLQAIFADAGKRSAGNVVYTEKCASCHGPQGQGMIGPNLTDQFWIHGDGSMSGVLAVVSTGVPDKGMPPWKALLKKEELLNVVAYVHGLKGTTPPNPKAPQGVEVK